MHRERISWSGTGNLPSVQGSGVLSIPGEKEIAAISRDRIPDVNWTPLWGQKRVLVFSTPDDLLTVQPFLNGLVQNGNMVGYVRQLDDSVADDIRQARPDVLFLPSPDDKSSQSCILRRKVLDAAGDIPSAVAYYDTLGTTKFPLVYGFSEADMHYKRGLMWCYAAQMRRTDFAQASLDVSRAAALEMGVGDRIWGVEPFGIEFMDDNHLTSHSMMDRGYLLGGACKVAGYTNPPFPKNYLLLNIGVHYDDEVISGGALSREWLKHGPVVNLMIVSGAPTAVDWIDRYTTDDKVRFELKELQRAAEKDAAAKYSGIRYLTLNEELRNVSPDGMSFIDRRKRTGRIEMTEQEEALIRETFYRIIGEYPGIDGVWVARPSRGDAHPDHQLVADAVNKFINVTRRPEISMQGLMYIAPWTGQANLFYYLQEHELEARRRWAEQHKIPKHIVEARELREHANAIAGGEMIARAGWGGNPVTPKPHALRVLIKPVEWARAELDRY